MIDEVFIQHIEGIFNEIFYDQLQVEKRNRVFLISDQVVIRAIDLVSGLQQQMQILIGDINTPAWHPRSSITMIVNDGKPSFTLM